MGSNGKSNNSVVVWQAPRIAKPGHREDYVLRVLAPTRKVPAPRVELRVWVDNQTSSPPFSGLSTRGGFFRMDIETFNAMVEAAPQIREAYKAAMPQAGEQVPESSVPAPPSLAMLGGVTKGTE